MIEMTITEDFNDQNDFNDATKRLEDAYSEVLETIDYGDGPRLIHLASDIHRMIVCRNRKISSMITQSSL